MTSTSDARRAVQETIEQLGGLDIILANAVCTCGYARMQVANTQNRAGRASPSGKILIPCLKKSGTGAGVQM